MDTAIAIRTAVIKDQILHVQAGAGVVADSVPRSEMGGDPQQRARHFPAPHNGAKRFNGRHPMLVMIDNYDSSTYNVVQYLGELGADVQVFRNDRLTVEELAGLKPERLVISPGPARPTKPEYPSPPSTLLPGKSPFWASVWDIKVSARPSGGHIIRAGQVMHGKTSQIVHKGIGVLPISRPHQAKPATIRW